MINGKKVLGLIPARGGSKGITRKNVRRLGDKPLIAWTIDEAKKSIYLDSLVVSTEDREIANISIDYGAEVPFMRPNELATDSAQTIDVVLHAVDRLPYFDLIVVLQPTSPLRIVDDIDGAVEEFDNRNINVVSVTEAAKPPSWMYTLDANRYLKNIVESSFGVSNRQEIPVTYVLNGAIYIMSSVTLREKRGFIIDPTLGYLMPSNRSIDLDTELDWLFAESLISWQRNKNPY